MLTWITTNKDKFVVGSEKSGGEQKIKTLNTDFGERDFEILAYFCCRITSFIFSLFPWSPHATYVHPVREPRGLESARRASPGHGLPAQGRDRGGEATEVAGAYCISLTIA